MKKENNSISTRHADVNDMASLMKLFVQQHNLSKGIQSVEIQEAWQKLMGTGVKNYTEKVIFKNGVLTVKITSTSLRNELSYGKEKIAQLLNEYFNEELVKKVILA